MLPTAEIQTAILARYRADVPLQGLLTGSTTPDWSIFDMGGVPTNRAFPYVGVFPITSQIGEDLSFGTDAVDTWVQVSIFTQTGQGGGFAKARAIAKRIYALTHEQALDLSGNGFNQYLALFENEQELPQNDGITQLIAHRYKVMTQSFLG